MSRSLFYLLIALALVGAACSSSAETTTTSSTTTTTTTVAPTTSVSPTTSSTTQPPTIAASGLPDDLVAEVESLYAWLMDEEAPRPWIPSPFLLLIEDVDVGDPPLRTSGSVAELPDGDQIAVVTVNEDVLLAANTGDLGWRIIGGQVKGAAPYLGGEPLSLLAIGSDARVEDPDQTSEGADSVHILTAVPSEGSGAILGIPRDTWVEVPGGSRKLTDVMRGTGPEALTTAVEDATGLTFDGYIVTGFEGFMGLIGELGRLVIDLPNPMASGNEWESFPAGRQRLGPNRALQLARIRKGLPEGDIDRSFNQGLIMQAGMAMVQALGVEALPDLLTVLADNTWTDLTADELLYWGGVAFLFTPEDLVNVVVPVRLGVVGAASVVFLIDESETVFRDLDDGLVEN